MAFALTARMVEILRVHRDACLGNGIGQTQFFHRKAEGTLTTGLGPSGNTTDYTTPNPRTADMPLNPVVNVWMTWEPVRLKGGVDGAIGGDIRAIRAWIYRTRGQCPVIDDNGNQVILTDEDIGIDPFGNKFRCENPSMSPDGSIWLIEIVRHR